MVEIGRFASTSICPGAREPDLSASASLQIIEVLSTSANQGTMESSRDTDTDDDTVALSRSKFFKLLLKLGNDFFVASEADFVRRLVGARATGSSQSTLYKR